MGFFLHDQITVAKNALQAFPKNHTCECKAEDGSDVNHRAINLCLLYRPSVSGLGVYNPLVGEQLRRINNAEFALRKSVVAFEALAQRTGKWTAFNIPKFVCSDLHGIHL